MDSKIIVRGLLANALYTGVRGYSHQTADERHDDTPQGACRNL